MSNKQITMNHLNVTSEVFCLFSILLVTTTMSDVKNDIFTHVKGNVILSKIVPTKAMFLILPKKR